LTRVKILEKHLRSADLAVAEKHPTGKRVKISEETGAQLARTAKVGCTEGASEVKAEMTLVRGVRAL
jgi:hypothetical protein